jgi:hypothetical protein
VKDSEKWKKVRSEKGGVRSEKGGVRSGRGSRGQRECFFNFSLLTPLS